MRTFLESGGEKGNTYYSHDALLLTTRGRRSGKLRHTALWYFEDGDRYLLVGSNGGLARHPAWYLNLRENPDVEVQVRGERFAARGRPADRGRAAGALGTARGRGPAVRELPGEATQPRAAGRDR
jgi:deazaflavin-dependent oxidoreductase (nitroreductase family)